MLNHDTTMQELEGIAQSQVSSEGRELSYTDIYEFMRIANKEEIEKVVSLVDKVKELNDDEEELQDYIDDIIEIVVGIK